MLASWPQRTAPVWFAPTLQKLLLFESSPHARWFRTPRHAGPPWPECGLRHRFSHHQPISKCSNHPFLLASGGPQGQCLVPYCSSALFGKHITHCYADDTQLYLCISSIPNAVVSPSPESKRPDVNSVSSIKSLSSSSLIPSTSTHPHCHQLTLHHGGWEPSAGTRFQTGILCLIYSICYCTSATNLQEALNLTLKHDAISRLEKKN